MVSNDGVGGWRWVGVERGGGEVIWCGGGMSWSHVVVQYGALETILMCPCGGYQ